MMRAVYHGLLKGYGVILRGEAVALVVTRRSEWLSDQIMEVEERRE